MSKTKSTKARRVAATREHLNVLMEAVALIIARRQMRRHWTTAHRATLSSII